MIGWVVWICGSIAEAGGTVVLTTDRPILFLVNGLPHPVAEAPVPVAVHDATGRVQLQVLNLLGQVQWRGSVDLPDGYEVRVRWVDRGLEVFAKVKIGEKPLVVQPATLLPIPEGDLDGPGDFTTAIDVDAPPAPAESAATPAAAATTSQLGASARVALVNRTTSWTTLTIDGVPFEFRDTRTHTVELAAGPHEVTVGDVTGAELWFTGTLVVPTTSSIELQFSRSQAPAILGHPDAWQAR